MNLQQLEPLISSLGAKGIMGNKVPPYRDRNVVMNDSGLIEVGQEEDAKRIGTSSLGGCIAVAALVQDEYGDRRCGLAHYDPMALRLELYKSRSLPSIVNLFHRVGKGNIERLIRKYVVAMSVDPERQQREFVQQIKIEAHYLLGCDNVTVIRYDSVPSDRLDVLLPNASQGSPSYSTVSKAKTLDWF